MSDWSFKSCLPFTAHHCNIAFFTEATVHHSFLHKLQRHRIDAVPESRWFRAVLEHVAKVCIALAANHFCAHHAMAFVPVADHVQFENGLVKTGPAGTGFKFIVRRKQGLPAADTMIRALFVVVPISTRECPFGSFVAGNIVLKRRQNRLPLGFGFHHFHHTFLSQRWKYRSQRNQNNKKQNFHED